MAIFPSPGKNPKMRRLFRSRRCFSICLTALSLGTLLSGCGTAEYEEQFQKRLRVLSLGTPFRDLYPQPITLTDTPASVRVPMMFNKPAFVENAIGEDQKPISPARIQPPFLKIPGFKLSYEILAPSEPAPSYFYFGALAVKEGEGQALAKSLHQQLKAAIPSAPDWEEIQSVTPAGDQIAWRRLAVSSSQPFECIDFEGNYETREYPAVFELWLHESNGYAVLIACRGTDSANRNQDLATKIKVTAGTVQVAKPNS